MSTLVIVGYGPGISHATAVRFGREGYAVALLGRTQERLDDGVAKLGEFGIEASAHRADASDPDALRTAIARVRADQGPIGAILWTAFRGGSVSDVLEARPEDVPRVLDVGVVGLLTTVQAALDDLTATSGALLVANGSVGEPTVEADGFAVALGIDGTALENAAKSKLVGILARRLADRGVTVGQISIAGSVAGTATASPTAIDPSVIADRLWSIVATRTSGRIRLEE